MNSERVFQVLLFLGLAASGWLYGDYWKKSGRSTSNTEESSRLRAQNADLVQDLDQLAEELAQLRSLLADGPYPVSDDLTAWVEKEHNLEFREIPDVRLASSTDLREAAYHNLRLVHGEENLTREGRAWEFLGLLPPNQRLPTQLLFVNSTGIKGIFDMTTGGILLSETFDPISVPDRSVLVRLLGQQLSFQHYPQKEWASRDQWQAWEAVHVGAAATLQARFLKRNEVANETSWENPEPQREELLNTLSPALQGFCNFPYLEGTQFARTRYRESRQAWSEMFRSPPTTTALILHPKRKSLMNAPINLAQDSGKILYADTLGELGLRLWLEPYLGIDQADQFAPFWSGDRYQLTEAGRSQSLVWKIRLSDAGEAAKLRSAIERSVLPVLRDSQPIRDLSITNEDQVITLSNLPRPR